MLNNKGFTLLELLIAIFVLSVGILGAYVAIQKSASIAGYSYSRLTAAYLAQEAIEIIRNVKDTNLLRQLNDPSVDWNEGLEGDCYEVEIGPLLSEIDCHGDLNNLKLNDGVYNYGSGIDTRYTRKIEIVSSDPSISLEIKSTVYWKDGGTQRKFEVWQQLYNWW